MDAGTGRELLEVSSASVDVIVVPIQLYMTIASAADDRDCPPSAEEELPL